MAEEAVSVQEEARLKAEKVTEELRKQLSNAKNDHVKQIELAKQKAAAVAQAEAEAKARAKVNTLMAGLRYQRLKVNAAL